MLKFDFEKIAIVGMGLIGGSFYKAVKEKGLAVTGIDRSDPVEVGDADFVIIALHPGLAIDWLKAHNKKIKPGALVLDVCGVKAALCKAAAELEKDWTFLGGHPMAGKEVSGFENSSAALFEGASMILTPQTEKEAEAAESLRPFFESLGFARVILTTPEKHDEMIAYTSQLCHILSNAYLRDELALKSKGFAGGSFRDLTRVGAPDPKLWTELFIMDREALLPIIDRFMERLSDFRSALEKKDEEAMRSQLREGTLMKEKLTSKKK